MSVEYLLASAESNLIKGEMIWERSETLTEPGNGATMCLPDGAGKINDWLAGLVITTGSGYIEYSLSNRADVVAENSSLNWRRWDAGVVVADADDILGQVSAVRMVNVSGTTRIETRAV